MVKSNGVRDAGARTVRRRRRRSRTGAICVCGSVNVVVANSRERQIETSPAGRRLLRREYVTCRTCGRHWARDVRVTEEMIV